MIIDTLLPGSISLSFVDLIASSPSRLGHMYGTQLMKDNNISNGAKCYFHGKLASMNIDWKPVTKKTQVLAVLSKLFKHLVVKQCNLRLSSLVTSVTF